MRRGWTSQGAPTSFRIGGESAAAAVVGSGEGEGGIISHQKS